MKHEPQLRLEFQVAYPYIPQFYFSYFKFLELVSEIENLLNYRLEDPRLDQLIVDVSMLTLE